MIKPTPHLTVVGSSTQQPSRAIQSVMERLRQLVLSRLEPACSEALSKADDALFDMSQNARANTSQQYYLDAMREIRRERGPMELLFRSHINASFHEFQHPGSSNAPEDATSLSMSLLAEDDLEEQLAAGQTVTIICRRFKQLVEPIAGGLARIAITINPSFDHATGPASPENLANAFRTALGGCTVPTEVKLVLFKVYERELLQALETLYPELLRTLNEAGFIAGHVPRTPSVPAARHVQQPVSQAPTDHVQQPINPMLIDQVPQREYPGGYVVPSNVNITYAGYQGSETDESMLNSLHDLLQVWRKVQRKDAGDFSQVEGAPEKPALSANELLSVLSLFQVDLPAGLKTALQSSDDDSLAEQIKRELITGAAALGISHGDTRIGDADEDAIDVVGMMFEVFLDERDIERDVRDQIARLLVPYIKVALIDRRLFLHKAHPARRLLNAIAEACEGNHGEGPQERELLQKVTQIVNRLVVEFNDELAIFATLEQELRSEIEQYRRRADLAERRVAEAQRGKERLEEARQRAESLLGEKLGSRMVSPLVQEDLRRFWAHHYAVVFLREGDGSEGCALALRTLDQMLALADAAFCTGGLTAVAETDSLQPGLLTMLASSGLADEAAVECARIVAQHLMQPLPQPVLAAVVSQPEIVAPTEPVEALVVDAPTLEAEPEQPAIPPEEISQEDVASLRQLGVGTWVEFIGSDGRIQPGKLSWVSPISARMLFVNRRGARMHVASVEELAGMMKAGLLKLRVADTAFEQAMHQVLGRLREQAATEGATANPA